MDMEKILQIEDPNEAMRQILLTAKDVKELEDSVEMYANFHKIEDYEMAYYPDGENVASTVEPEALLLQIQQTKEHETMLTPHRTEEMLQQRVIKRRIKKMAKTGGLVVAAVILGCLGLVAIVAGIGTIAGVILAIYEKLEGILNVAVPVGCVAVLIRTIMVLSAIIPRKNDTEEKRGGRLQTLQNSKWLAICILFLVLFPIQCWLSIIHAPVPEGTYIVDLEYRLAGEDETGYERIDKKGIAPFKIKLYDDVEYEDYTYYSGGVELEGTRISQDTRLYVESVVLPDYGEYELSDDDVCGSGEEEIEINGIYCT